MRNLLILPTILTNFNNMPAAVPNRLIHASSPYLQQHAHNPVDWFPWGEEALDKARNENRLIIVSIGYAACHWCHVMEHESFEDAEVAALMNGFFVPVKVDREERPDIDQVYMNAAYLSTGRGGWPLNAIALPDGRPVFAGTYFPKQNWLQVLGHFAKLWQERSAELEEIAGRMKDGIRQIDHEAFSVSPPGAIHESDVQGAAENILAYMDLRRGGLDKSPKFPMPSVYQFLLRYHYHRGEEDALSAVTITLDGMMNGGIYDAVGGGFARYSTDERWFAPHFEKMLYDNGQLISLYAEAFRVTGDRTYLRVVEETLGWAEREMLSEEGGFYASLDADSEGEEGKFYTWGKQEIDSLLGKDAGWFCEYYGVTENGNWEHTNILAVQRDGIPGSFPLSPNEWDDRLRHCLDILLKARSGRIRPGLDDKILTSWNALMIKGYTDAYLATGNESWLSTATRAAEFISGQLAAGDHRLYRNYKDGIVSVPGFLDDYAFYIEALISLYQAGFREDHLLEAKAYLESVIRWFYVPDENVFYYSPSDFSDLVVRTKEMTDNVIPASNSAMARNLYTLGKYFENDEWITISEAMCRRMVAPARKQGAYHSSWAMAFCMHVYGVYEVALCGSAVEPGPETHFLPDVLWMASRGNSQLPLLEGKTGTDGAYVCREKACQAPVPAREDAIKLIIAGGRQD